MNLAPSRHLKSLGLSIFALAAALAGCGGSDTLGNAFYTTVGGTISGSIPAGLVLENNGQDTLSVAADSTTFRFATPLANGASSSVTVASPPAGMNCTVANGSGIVTIIDTSNISVACNSLISKPLQVGVYPSGDRIYIPVTAVGSVPVNLPLIFDTGSSGLTLEAESVFPSGMVAATGFAFPPGQTTMTYQGITVTSTQASKAFGSAANGTTQLGNLGFAQVVVGDTVQTKTMPIFLYYAIKNTASGQVIPMPDQKGIFGANIGANPLIVANSSAPATLAICNAQSTTSCDLVSPFRYLDYASGTDAGFALSPVALQNCDITQSGNCTAANALTVGVTPASEKAFALSALSCPGAAPAGTYNSLPICEPALSNVRISASGASFTGSVLLDSGTGAIVIQTPAQTNFPASLNAGTPLQFSFANGQSYSVAAGGGTTAVNVTSGTRSILGIDFFTRKAFVEDFTMPQLGWQ